MIESKKGNPSTPHLHAEEVPMRPRADNASLRIWVAFKSENWVAREMGVNI